MMGFRLRRSIRVFPGVKLNLGKRGISTSIGGRGAHVTIGHGQVRASIGIPGSGLSYTHVEGGHHKTSGEASGADHATPVINPLPKGKAWRGWLWIAAAVAMAAFFGKRYLAP